jgi:hypothetical protein
MLSSVNMHVNLRALIYKVLNIYKLIRGGGKHMVLRLLTNLETVPTHGKMSIKAREIKMT